MLFHFDELHLFTILRRTSTRSKDRSLWTLSPIHWAFPYRSQIHFEYRRLKIFCEKVVQLDDIRLCDLELMSVIVVDEVTKQMNCSHAELMHQWKRRMCSCWIDLFILKCFLSSIYAAMTIKWSPLFGVKFSLRTNSDNLIQYAVKLTMNWRNVFIGLIFDWWKDASMSNWDKTTFDE